MKTYEKPEIEIEVYKTEDVICQSEGYNTPEV